MLCLTLFSQGIIILTIIFLDYSLFDFFISLSYLLFGTFFRYPGKSRKVENAVFSTFLLTFFLFLGALELLQKYSKIIVHTHK